MLNPGTTYYYRVKAVSEESESGYSETVAVNTLSSNDSLITPAPAGTPVIFKIVPSSTSLLLYLELPVASERIQEYKVTVSVNSDYSTPVLNSLAYVVGDNAAYAVIENTRYLVCTLPNLAVDTLYYVRIRSVNSISTSGNATATARTSTALTAPINIGITNLTAITARANWAKTSDATSYVLEVSTSSTFSTYVVNNIDVGDVDFYNIPVLIERTVYYYRVRAKAGSVLSPPSKVIAFTTLDNTATYNSLSYSVAAPVITGVFNVFTDSFSIRWSAIDSALGYSLDVSTVANFSSFVIQDSRTLNNTFRATGLTAGTVYHIRVKTLGINEDSTYSSTITTTLALSNTLTPPLLLAPVVYTTSLRLSWVKRVYALGYFIQVSTSSNFSSLVYSTFVGDLDTFTVDSLLPNTVYYVRIYGFSSTQTSAASASVMSTTSAALPAITVSTVTELGTDKVRLNWSLNSSYTKYTVTLFKTVSSEGTVPLGNGFFSGLDVGNVATYFVDVFLQPGTDYTYIITGITSLGDTNQSSVQSFRTKSKAPIAQLSTDCSLLEWSGDVNRIDASTDKEFKSLVRGWVSRPVENIGTFNVSDLTSSEVAYYFRCYFVANNVSGEYSNIVSSLQKIPTLLPIEVKKTSATLSWRADNVYLYKLQLLVFNTGNYIPVSGYSSPVDLGTSTSLAISNLSPFTSYRVVLYYLPEGSSTYVRVPVATDFATNGYTSSEELSTSGAAPTGSVGTPSFDRVLLSLPLNTYIIETSLRADFLKVENYIEFVGSTVSVSLTANMVNYCRVFRVVSSTVKTNPLNFTITAPSIPAYQSSVNAAPSITGLTILNDTQAIINFTAVSNALGYKVEVSTTSTFTALDTSIRVVMLDITRALLSGLIGSRLYYVRVYGYAANSIGPYSSTVTIDSTP